MYRIRTHAPTCSPAARPRFRSVALVCALTVASSAWAQSVDTNEPTGTRDLFVATIATLLAQGIGSGLSEGVAGTIKGWFKPKHKAKPKASDKSVAVAAATIQDVPGTGTLAPGGDTTPTSATDTSMLYAGLAYEVRLLTPSGGSRVVDPARHHFQTGDRFEVQYRPTLPGRVLVSNLDPAGNASTIDAQDVAAAQLKTLGPYEFVGSPGIETLQLAMTPCGSPEMNSVTRSIVKADAGAPLVSAAPSIAECNDPRVRGLTRRIRSIEKTAVQGSTTYSLDAVSKDERQSGLLAQRTVSISLQHR